MGFPLSTELTALAASLRRDLDREDRSLLERWPIEHYVDDLEAIEPYRGYRWLPAGVRQRCMQIETSAGRSVLETYHRLLLVTLLGRLEHKLASLALPVSIRELTVDFVQRIRQDIERPRPNYFVHDNDRFAKDLSVCRAKMLPCGPELVDLYAGFPRRALLSPPRKDIFRRLAFFVSPMGGFRPVYETHMDRRLIGEFSPRGYEHCYRRLAELLRLNPDVRGVVFGATWFVDPALESISPELSYLRTVPISNGARLFPVAVDEHAIRDATRTSLERRRFFQQGRYQPRTFLIVWPRRPMIAWAGRTASQ